ncbi:MAG: ABC transporter ATP-binding protein [Proteobacteria bacterium]|nr:ABC transporter ATP-binding protein [Pseudomonadota bacterium]MBU1611250.1 ABC transporter ATP-binding protein [Pseudomonadota bacterium]
MLEARNLTKTYAGEGSPALDSVSMTVQPGDFVCITGRSGSGKSTLLNVLSTLLTPDTGEVLYEDMNLALLPSRKLDRLRGTEFSMVFQMHHLLPYMTAVENVCLTFMKGLGSVGTQRRNLAMECLERVGLSGKEHKLPGELSGGEQQRVAIARALVSEPRVIFADEPTGSLDKATGQEVMDILFGLNRDGITVVMVTHEPEYARLAGRHVQMEDGRIISG